MSSMLQIRVGKLEDWYEEETASLLEPIREKGIGILVDLGSKLDDVRDVSDRLFEDAEKEMRRGDSKTYHASRAASRLARNLSEKIGKIAIPKRVSYESIKLLNDELEEMLMSIGKERRRWLQHIEPFFIMDRRKLDMGFRKIVESTEKIRKFLSQDYTNAKTIENLFSAVDIFVESLKDFDKSNELKKQNTLKLKALDEKIAENQKKIQQIKNQKNAHDLVEINRRIEELTQKTKYSFRHLQKPLLKFQSLIRGDEIQINPAEKKKLNDLLNDTFEALATEEEGYPVLKTILQKMMKAMVQNKLKLKSSRFRKAEEQIKEILLNNALSNLRQECKKTRAQRQWLLTSEATSNFQKELKQVKADLKNLKVRRNLAKLRLDNLKENRLKKLQKIQDQKKVLENGIFESTGKEIKVII